MDGDWWAWLVVVIPIIAAVSTLLINFIRVGQLLPPRKLTRWTRGHRKSINQYSANDLQELLTSKTPGSTRLTVRDLVESEDLFIPPRWCLYPPSQSDTGVGMPAPSSQELQKYLIERILNKERVLLLGDPGQGKSTLLKRVYCELVHRFQSNSSDVLPLYIPCRDLHIGHEASRGLEGLYQYLHTGNNPLLLSEGEFRTAVKNKMLVFLFDGFDEIHGELNQDSINRLVNSDIFLNPGLLSCRTHFYEFRLSCSPLDTGFPTKICLLPLEQKDVERYISQVLARQEKRSLFADIAQEIRSDSKLGDLSKRLLLLVMITDIYTSGIEFRKGQWNTARLYDEYTRVWLKHEASKSRLRWRDKSELLEDVAWEIFRAKQPTSLAYADMLKVTISHTELSTLFARLEAPGRYNLPLAEVVEDLCSHSCLATSGETYHFAHRSFQEYFVARHVIRSLQSTPERTLEALNRAFPAEIAAFLKDMLESITSEVDKVEIVTRNMTGVYKLTLGMQSREALITREQAGYYLSRLKTNHVAAFLEAAIREEPDKWVKRGMIIGLIYKFRRRDILENYVRELYADPEADLINLGYHLEYYGDQPADGDHIYKSYTRCDHTVRAILRHLDSPEEHSIGWALDLLTLRRLLCETGREKPILSGEHIEFVKEFLLSAPQGEQVFEVERQALLVQFKEQNIL